jgi:hypothetical protein
MKKGEREKERKEGRNLLRSVISWCHWVVTVVLFKANTFSSLLLG